MAKKLGLGRGLDALLGGVVEETAAAANPAAAPVQPETRVQAGDAVVQLRLSDIDPNRDQPRRRFDECALQELADSIKAVGVIQPILVRKTGDRYTGAELRRGVSVTTNTSDKRFFRMWELVKE